MLGALVDVSGICRFFLKSVSPYAELYVSPVNIDPADPTMPISTPESYAKELVEEVGYFYTQGMPEDTSALSARVLNDDEYRQQATFVLEERMRFFRHELNRFREGFLFFYFSSLDLDSHAFWRSIDPHHPLYTEELNRKHGDFLPWLYHRIDEAVGMAMQQMDDKTLLMVISDHGFVSFRRQFNLNSWLMDNGYARPLNRMDRGQTSYFMNTDWSGTKAYGLGINSLYLNIRGREPDGIVEPGEEAEALRSELIARLTSIVDEKTGSRAIRNVYRPEEIYSGAHVGAAPDLVVCYNENYRASWDTILGKYPREVLLDNLDPWSGDHCMDPAFLSGVFMCNRPLQVKQPALQDLSPAILSAFGVPSPGSMRDRKVLG
jgi:predicted AlkP superfamily phosphohydrolase/phosphomutase